MPISQYYKGRGRSVMSKMRSRYGSKQGKKIFYATVNKWRTKGSKKQKSAQPKRAPGARRKTRRGR